MTPLEGSVVYGGALFAWWLALYLVTRGEAGRVSLLAAGAAGALAVYLLGQALAGLATDPALWEAWQRRTWWGAALAPALWLGVILALADAEAEAPAARRAWSVAALALGGAAAALGIATDLVVAWSTPAPGRLYPVFLLYVWVCLLAALGVVVTLWRRSAPGTPLRSQFGWLAWAGVLFLLAGGYGVTANRLLGLPALPGELLLLAGAGLMGWSVARYGALLAGEVVARDFAASGVTTLALVGAYGALALLGVEAGYGWLERALVLLLLAAATHVLVNTRSRFLDRLLYGPAAGALRGQLGAVAARAGRQPDTLAALAEAREGLDALVRAQEGGGWRIQVEGALRHLNDLPTLAQHPLLERLPPGRVPSGRGETPLERAGRLRGEIAAAIDRLRPGGPRPAPGSSLGPGGWLHHLVLYEAYVDGRPNKQVMQRYHLSEGTFHRARRRAVDVLAADLDQAWGAHRHSRRGHPPDSLSP
ncbi:MAG TPA: hypothetical protein VGM69_03095 [Chloroflexota bacterium]